MLQGENEGAYAKSKDEMTSMIEKSRKNMVIKLKGETKKVDPKTGKTYEELPKGSAIEVLGQPSKSSKSNLNNTKGILPSKCDSVKTRAKSPMEISRSSPIPTLTGGVARSPSPVNIRASTPNSIMYVPSSVARPVAHVATESNFIPTVCSGQSVLHNQPNTFIHPLTGQSIQYGRTSPVVVSPQTMMPYPFPTMVQPRPVSFQPVPLALPGFGAMPNVAPPANTMYNQQSNLVQVPQVGYGIHTQPHQQAQNSQQISTPGNFTQTLQSNTSQPVKQIQTPTEDKNLTVVKSETGPKDFVKREEKVTQAKTEALKNEPVIKKEAYSNRNTNIVQIPLKDEKELRQKRTSNITESGPEIKKIKKEESGDEKKAISKQEVKGVKMSPKKSSDLDKKVNDFGSRILETLSEVKNSAKTLKEPVKETKISVVKVEPESVKSETKVETAIMIDSEESELEDGEISDSDTEDAYVSNRDTRIVQDRSAPGPGYVGMNERLGPYHHGPHPSFYESPKRVVRMNENFYHQQAPIQTVNGPRSFRGARNAAADWSDIIQNPDTRAVERVRATQIESPSLRNTNYTNKQEENDLLSKSLKSISKTKQKIVAQSQVKTLGEWLKIELETDNIEPLKNIIPYSFDTDLTGITKTKRRKIRMKVKNLIEQEGLKRVQDEQEKTEKVPPQPDPVFSQPSAPVNPNYLPEVHNDDLQKELLLLRNATAMFRKKVEFVEKNPTIGQFSAEKMSYTDDKKILIAMALVQNEMNQLLLRTCFYGYPHRRVPNELLLSTEFNTFKSPQEDVFLILMMPISAKPYLKLSQMKQQLEKLYSEKNTAGNPDRAANVEAEIHSLHSQRQSLLRSFTGYLNKKRIQKIQETADKYTIVYEHFKAEKPPVPDGSLKHIRTTQMDLRQHLILAKQYLVSSFIKVHVLSKNMQIAPENKICQNGGEKITK